MLLVASPITARSLQAKGGLADDPLSRLVRHANALERLIATINRVREQLTTSRPGRLKQQVSGHINGHLWEPNKGLP